MLQDVSISSYIMSNGERYCLLVDSISDLPLYYPNLFVTSQIRNRSLSYSAMESALGGIMILMRYLNHYDINIEDRFLTRSFFEPYELDALRDFSQIKLSSTKGREDVGIVSNSSNELDKQVILSTLYARLSSIAKYLKWLAETFLPGCDKNTMLQIEKMQNGIKSRRPRYKGRNQDFVEKGLSRKQVDVLFDMLRPASNLNPFDKSVQIRNRLMVLLLYYLGLRGGELLNIRVRDIDFQRNQLLIVRRADEKDDMRIYQPLVKTQDRRLPVKNTLIRELHQFILNDRKNIKNASKHDYLFITYKSGPTQGLAISKSAYQNILNVIRCSSPILDSFTGHALRHTWNDRFSVHLDNMDLSPSEEKQEKMRSYIMGWKEGSGTASTYNKRFIKEKASDAALALQEGVVRFPQELKIDET